MPVVSFPAPPSPGSVPLVPNSWHLLPLGSLAPPLHSPHLPSVAQASSVPPTVQLPPWACLPRGTLLCGPEAARLGAARPGAWSLGAWSLGAWGPGGLGGRLEPGWRKVLSESTSAVFIRMRRPSRPDTPSMLVLKPLCQRVCVRICVCVCLCVCVYVSVFISMYLSLCLSVCVFVCLCICVCV